MRIVPRDVDDRAAPAAKEWMRGKPNAGVRMKERAMGVSRPVRATQMDRGSI